MNSVIFLSLLMFFSFSTKKSDTENVTSPDKKKTFFDFKTKTIDGEDFDLATLKGKKILVVNTASKCGLTPQYEDLQKLYEKYGSKKFTIIGFPANNFLSQESGTNTEIKQFCTKNYGVTFQMMQKISVKGKDIDPIYAWLTQKKQNGVTDAKVSWNFQKFMINPDGSLHGYVSPKKKPFCEEIVSWIEAE